MATTARRWSAALGQHRQVEALVAPAGDQHHRGEAARRRPGWRGARCLRVVVPAHAVRARRPARPGGRARGRRAARARTPSTVGAAARARWPRRRARWRRRGAAPRHSSSTADERVARRADAGRRRRRGSRRRPSSPKVTVRARAGCAGPSRPGRRRWPPPRRARARGRPRCGPWPPRRPSSDVVHVQVVRRRSSATWPPPARSGRVWPSRNDDASTTNTSSRRVVDGLDQRHLGVADGHRPAGPTRSSISVTSVVTVVLPSVPVMARRAGRPTPRPGRTR